MLATRPLAHPTKPSTTAPPHHRNIRTASPPMSDAAYNIFGAVAGALGLIGLLPFICLVVKCQLPIAKAKELDDILADTKEFLLFVVEEGHLTDEAFAYEVGGDLDRYVLLLFCLRV